MFCSNCGRQIDSGQVVCSNCGNPIIRSSMTHEETVTHIRRAQQIGFGAHPYFDLYFTQSRLVGIKMSSGGGFGSAFGLVGSLTETAIKNHQHGKRSEEMQGQSLEQMLQGDEDNFQMGYDGIQNVKVISSALRRLIEIKPGEGGSKKFALSKENVASLQSSLPSLRGLEGKLDLPR